ncbi:inhibitor of nuclear factor kappa-B kinase-interacting protein isoform X1 [Ambystoma mexicanum]|uniref:inhibitor of nuclear factor kappa-B kinase-interacting protein isoform X1 n=1 Tax=Ambystoma mexicanum TaxID=8296 RepID=UPI0037E76232
MFLPHLHPEALPSGICPRPPDLPVCGSLKGDACEHARTSGLYKPIDAVLAGFIVVKAVLGKLAFIHLYVHNIDSRCLRIFKMSNDVKQRRKGPPKPNEEGKAEHPKKAANTETLHSTLTPAACTDSPRLFLEPRTLLCILSLCVCVASTWFAFEQSVAYSSMQKRFTLLEMKASELKALEDKIGLLFEKLETSDGVWPESTSTIPIVTRLEKEVSSLRRTVHELQEGEQALSQQMQSVNEKFQNVTDVWQNNFDEMKKDIGILKTEAKDIHNHVTLQINTAEKVTKSISERLNELDDSTVRNTRTLKRQEEDELLRVEQQLDRDAKAIEKLDIEKSVLISKNTELSKSLRDYEPKLEECRKNLPLIETAVRTVLKVSNELLGIEKKMEDLTMQTFNMEDNMLKAVSEILSIQQILEGMQYDKSILKMQNELVVLKERVQDYALSFSKEGINLPENNSKAAETTDEN